jgi:hypothetical protein
VSTPITEHRDTAPRACSRALSLLTTLKGILLKSICLATGFGCRKLESSAEATLRACRAARLRKSQALDIVDDSYIKGGHNQAIAAPGTR